MPRYRYKALNSVGAAITGDIEAASADSAILELQSNGYFPLSTAPANARSFGHLTKIFSRRKANANSLVVVTRELAVLLAAGLPLDRALDLAVDLAPDPAIGKMLAKVRDKVRTGSGLANALESSGGGLSKLYVTLVRAGEMTGDLEDALTRLADYLQRAAATREQIKSALVYPIILLATGGLSLTFILTGVLPKFKPFFDEAGQTLPVPTQIVMGVVDFLSNWGWILILMFVGGGAFFRYRLSELKFRRRVDRQLLKLPVIGPLISEQEAARFSHTLSTLLKAGIELPAALPLACEALNNTAMAEALGHAATRLREGESLGTLLAKSKIFPALAAQLVRVGEETGRLDAMLLHQSILFERSAERTITRLLAALVPGLTIFLGLLVAGIIASVVLALLKINDLAN